MLDHDRMEYVRDLTMSDNLDSLSFQEREAALLNRQEDTEYGDNGNGGPFFSGSTITNLPLGHHRGCRKTEKRNIDAINDGFPLFVYPRTKRPLQCYFGQF